MKATAPLPASVAKHSRRTKPFGMPTLNGGTVGRVKSILVPVDFSPPSMKALKYAVDLAALTRAHLTLLNVMEVVVVPDFVGDRLVLPTDDAVQERQAELKRMAAECGCTPGMIADVKIRKGTAFQEITRAARDLKVDLIILATHGYTGVKRVLLGSTAERVIRHAACPVLVVPGRK